MLKLRFLHTLGAGTLCPETWTGRSTGETLICADAEKTEENCFSPTIKSSPAELYTKMLEWGEEVIEFQQITRLN